MQQVVASTTVTPTLTITVTTAVAATTTVVATVPVSCRGVTNPYIASNGDVFRIRCTGFRQGTSESFLGADYANPSFQACLEMCATTSGCLLADYFGDTSANSGGCEIYSSLAGAVFARAGFFSGELVLSPP